MNLKRNPFHKSSAGRSCGCGTCNDGMRVGACDARTVKSISRVGDQAIIAFDDCTYIAAPFNIVDMPSVASGKGSDCSDLEKAVAEKDTIIAEQKAKLAALEAQANDKDCDVLKRYLVPVHNLADETIYYGLKPGMSCPELENADAEDLGGNDVPAVNPTENPNTPERERERDNSGHESEVA